MFSHILLTPPAVEPVSLDELKNHARVSADDDDVLLTGLGRAARQWCEHYTRRAFIEQVWSLSGPPPTVRAFIALLRGPVIDVDSVDLYDENDNPTAWGAEHYYLDARANPPRLVLREGASWPDATRAESGMVVTYRAGYGQDGASVPDPLRLAVMQLAVHWYEHRGEAVTGAGAAAQVPLTVEALLAPYRAMTIAVTP